MSVSICVLTFNRSSLLRHLLLSLQRLKYEPLQIIIVDNHSEDGTQEMMKEHFDEMVYIRTDRNIGASARNIGLKNSKGEFIITLDDDVTGVSDDSIIYLRHLFFTNPKLGAVNCKIVDHITGELSNWVHHCKAEDYSNKEFFSYEITEGAVAFRKAALEKCGYYAESFFLSHEGPDLALRLMNSGYEVLYTNSVVVTHHHSKLGREGWLNYYYDTRNQFWLVARNFPVGYAFVYLVRGLSSMLIYSARDGYMRHYIRGVRDGLKGMRKALKERSVVTKDAMAVVKRIDSNRPGSFYMIKMRVLRRGARL